MVDILKANLAYISTLMKESIDILDILMLLMAALMSMNLTLMVDIFGMKSLKSIMIRME